MVPTWRICFYNWEILKLVIISLILVTFTIDLRVILYGELRRSSLIGVLGLIDMSLEVGQKVNKDVKLKICYDHETDINLSTCY